MAEVHIRAKQVVPVSDEAEADVVTVTYGLPLCRIPSNNLDSRFIQVDWPIRVDCPTCILKATLNGLG